jgi:hypothetical protein
MAPEKSSGSTHFPSSRTHPNIVEVQVNIERFYGRLTIIVHAYTP